MSINTAVFPQQGQPIPLGRQGESNARTIVFEIYGWLREYGEGGTFLLLHKRPNDQAAYLVPFTMSPNGTEIFWKVSAVDTDKDTSGSFGEAELRYEVTTNDGTTKVKSDLYRTMVAKSLDEYNPRYPDVPEPEGGGLILRPVLERPTVGEENIIYLVPNDASEDPENVYVEWIYVNNAWEEWGKYIADVDIASKADLSYVNAQLELKQDKISATGTNIKPVYFSSAGTATPIPGYVPDPSNDNPLMDGTASPGTSTDFSRKDHRHPHDSTKQDKLVATGSAVQGVYISESGEASAMTYLLNKTVPANAVFTDTTYDPATSSTNGLMTGSDKAKLDRISLPAGGVSLPVILANQSIANFDGAAGRPLRVTANIEAVQDAGTPSPSNPLPIAGWTGANIAVTNSLALITITPTQAPGTPSPSNPLPITGVTLPQAGTVYGGTLDVAKGGLLTVTHGYQQITELTSEYTGVPEGSIAGYVGVGTMKANSRTNGKCNMLSPVNSPGGQISGCTFGANNQQFFAVFRKSETAETFQGLNAWLAEHPLQIVFPLTTPLTYQLTQQETKTALSELGYTGAVYSVSFPSSAGTIYGGTLDVVRGLLTVTHGQYASYSGQTLPGVWISSEDVYTPGGTPTTGAQVVYALASPGTYQLIPQQFISIDGTNNVFADCGSVTVTHWPGTGTPVEPIEDSSEIEWKKGILARLEALEAGG